MSSSTASSRTPAYKPALAAFAGFGSAWVFLLVALGAFTTSIGAGMAFADWPTSNGSFNPHGWLTNLAMFAEHSHRLSAGVMSTVTILLAVWLWRSESRAWLRKLAYFAVALVLVQAVVGGLRVLYDSQHVGTLDTSLGRLFAMLHACLAQLFACTLIAVATACSKAWIDSDETPLPDRARSLGRLCVILLFVQLAIAAVMRHSFAGLAIPTFPASNIDGGLLPAAWNFRVGIHFAHRVMALVLCIALPWFAFTLLNVPGAAFRLRVGAAALLALLIVQVSLGAQIIWTYRAAAVTTGHVLVGALTLVTTFWLTWNAHRDAIEPKAAA